ncbi:MAG: type II secretion system protein GspC [Pseudomonadota bacterium]
MRWTYLIIDRYRTITNIAGTVLFAWLLSAIVGQVIGMVLSKKAPTQITIPNSSSEDRSLFAMQAEDVKSYIPICERNIFDSQRRTPCGLPELEPEDEQDLDASPVKSDIAATLIGTIVWSDPNRSYATIAPRSGEASNYHIGDSILNEAKIYDVQRNRVFFIRNGHREYIEVERLASIYGDSGGSQSGPPPSGGGIRRVGDKTIVNRSKVDQVLGNLNQIVQESRMVPNLDNGVVNGFKIFAIKPGSIFQDLGIQNGDVIQRINGTEIDSVEKAVPMLQVLRDQSAISIDLLRGGTKKTLSIDIR